MLVCPAVVEVAEVVVFGAAVVVVDVVEVVEVVEVEVVLVVVQSINQQTSIQHPINGCHI